MVFAGITTFNPYSSNRALFCFNSRPTSTFRLKRSIIMSVIASGHARIIRLRLCTDNFTRGSLNKKFMPDTRCYLSAWNS